MAWLEGGAVVFAIDQLPRPVVCSVSVFFDKKQGSKYGSKSIEGHGLTISTEQQIRVMTKQQESLLQLGGVAVYGVIIMGEFVYAPIHGSSTQFEHDIVSW